MGFRVFFHSSKFPYNPSRLFCVLTNCFFFFYFYWVEAGQRQRQRVLLTEHTGHSEHPLPTTQELTIHGHHQMVNTEIGLIIFFVAEDGENLWQSAKTRPGADCCSDHELLIAKFRLKLKKVGKTARPFRYDLNQIPYDYTVEVRNWFKVLDLIECLKNYGRRFVTLYSRQWSKLSPLKRNAKWQKGCLRKPYK